MTLSHSQKGDKVTAFSHLVRRRSRRRSAVAPPFSGPPLLMRNKNSSRKKPSSAPPPSSSHGVGGISPLPPSLDPSPDLPSPSLPEARSDAATSDLSVASPVLPSEALSKASSQAASRPSSLSIAPTSPRELSKDMASRALQAPITSANDPKVADPAPTAKPSATTDAPWLHLFKGNSRPLTKKGTAFTLPSGEACVKIPISIIEKHQKAWDCFILGQFYSDPPAQGTIHAIVNGIWSKFHRDISVTKMEGNAFLFRVPNASTRNRILTQGLWQIEGQTMFVANWKPGSIPQKLELSSAPVWLELRNVPLQFFNEDGFEFIAGLVGEPKGLHPSTANLSNLEVAKVFTLIDPRKPLPEAVNVQFPSSEISRVLVSSPWMPPVCPFCKEVGHNLKRCKVAPVSCHVCNSTCHSVSNCPRAKAKPTKKASKLKPTAAPGEISSDSPLVASASSIDKGKAIEVGPGINASLVKQTGTVSLSKSPTTSKSEWIQVKPNSAAKKDMPAAACSSSPATDSSSPTVFAIDNLIKEQDSLDSKSLASDSSDLLSSEDGVDPEINESQFLKMFSQRQQRVARGKGPKHT